MSLLASTTYDPATLGSVAPTGLRGMTVLDSTNLRLSFTVPSSGIVRVRVAGMIYDSAATTLPQVLVGILQSSTVMGRISPYGMACASGTTAWCAFDGQLLIKGLTPSASLTWDAAYGVEILLASTTIRWGGPNNTTGADAAGALSFEIHSV